MIDAARLPYEENVRETTNRTVTAQRAGLWVEAELGEIGGKGGAHASGARTDPEEACAFVASTGVDGLAVSVRSTHALTTAGARLDLELLARIAARVPLPLVLHGSSGVTRDGLEAAIRAGIRRINVGTALNMAYTGEVRSVLDGDPRLTHPRLYLAPARAAVAQAVLRLASIVQAP